MFHFLRTICFLHGHILPSFRLQHGLLQLVLFSGFVFLWGAQSLSATSPIAPPIAKAIKIDSSNDGKQQYYWQLPEIQAFIGSFSKKHGVDKQRLIALFSKIAIDQQQKEKILSLSASPIEKTASWQRYKDIFITPVYIKKGQAFHKKHRATLEQAYRKYGVDTKIIVATLGMETAYGTNTGKHPVLESLAIESFFGKRRQKFFQRELTYLLLLHFKEGLEIGELLGSYSGAIGPAQFMPTSIYYYSIDANGDGNRDMLADYEDVIFSVAHYYYKARWKKKGKVATPLSKENWSAMQASLDGKKTLKLKELTTDKQGKETEYSTKYYLLHPNFAAIKRYNNSVYYAMTLFLLSQKL